MTSRSRRRGWWQRGRSEDGTAAAGAAFVVCVMAALVIGVLIRPVLFEEERGGPLVTPTTTPPTALEKKVGPFENVFEQARSSVVRLDAVVCEVGGGVGSGFLVDARHVATAAHVVDSAVAITARNGDHVRVARVIGIDNGRDIALLQLDKPLDGTPFPLVAERVPLTTRVAALGYANGRGLAPAEGTINGYDRKEKVGDRTIGGLVLTDADINRGNSGGPLVTESGQTVGLVIAGAEDADGIAFAVDATKAALLLQRWQQSPEPPPAQDCANPSVPVGGVGTATKPTGAAAAEIAVALGIYFEAINSGQYGLAWQQYSSQRRRKIPIKVLASGRETSQTSDHELQAIATQPDGSVIVHFTFVSTQDPGDGPKGREDETCTEWSNDYRMVFEEGRWVMDQVTGHRGATSNSAPCQEGD